MAVPSPVSLRSGRPLPAGRGERGNKAGLLLTADCRPPTPYNARRAGRSHHPALDEEHAIGALLEAVDRTVVRDVIVGDNGSRDATGEVARSRGAQVVRIEERGYGAACAGALAAMAGDVDVVLFMDADGSDDPAEIPFVLEPVLSGRPDLAMVARAGGRGARRTHAAAALRDWLATRLVALLYGHRYTTWGRFAPFAAICSIASGCATGATAGRWRCGARAAARARVTDGAGAVSKARGEIEDQRNGERRDQSRWWIIYHDPQISRRT